MNEERSLWDAWWTGGRKDAMTYPTYAKAMQDWVALQSHSGQNHRRRWPNIPGSMRSECTG